MTRAHQSVRHRPSHSSGGRTQAERSERTRAAIRDAANRLFLEHGVDGTTVDAICAAAGVSKGAFYLYFHRKEDLLLEYGLRRLRRIREMLPDLIAYPTFRDALNKS